MWATPLSFWVVGLDLPSWLFDLAAWGVIALELSLGFALFSKRARLFAAIAGTGFHISIFLLLDFPEFFVCVCAYVLFFDDATIRSVPQRVSRYTTRWRLDR